MPDTRLDKPQSGLAEVLRLSWPASLSMLNSTLMRFVDGLMVAATGPAALAAQMNGGLASFVPESFGTGALMAVNTYVSQNFGAGRLHRCAEYAWAGMLLAVALGLLQLPLIFFAQPIFAAMGHAPDVTALEVMYFRYMLLSVFLTLTSRPLEQFFYGIHRSMIVLVVSIISNLVNLLGAYALIFGKLGFPAMGLEGAAIATLVAWAVQLSLLLAFFLGPEMNRQYGTRKLSTTRLRECAELLKVGWPAGVQFLNDILPWAATLMVLVGRFGTVHQAAAAAAMRYMPLSFMPAVGIGVAATALVGKYIGRGEPDIARKRAHICLALALGWMAVCGVLFWVFRYPMVELFVAFWQPGEIGSVQAAEQAQIMHFGAMVMICSAIFQIFDCFGIIYVGALRGAGDTLWPMLVNIPLAWVIMVLGGWLMTVFVPQLTSIGPWIAATIYLIVLGILMAARFERGAWRKIDLLGREGRRS